MTKHRDEDLEHRYGRSNSKRPLDNDGYILKDTETASRLELDFTERTSRMQSIPTITPQTRPTAEPKQTSSTTTTESSPIQLHSKLGVLPWNDPTQSDTGHDPRSAYVETFWLPILGPSSTLLLRRLADELDSMPEGFEIDCASLSRDIGLGPRLDQRGSFSRTLERCAKFQMLEQQGGVVYLRRLIPRLRDRQVTKLSNRLQQLHHSWTIDPVDDGPARRIELVRAAHLARTLLDLGETSHTAETQLHQWQFHPSIAWHAVQWALTGPEQLP